jgi:hypothetical protein
VTTRFTPAQHHADTVPSRWHVTFSAPDGDVTRAYVAHFVWGLLQSVEKLPSAGLSKA